MEIGMALGVAMAMAMGMGMAMAHVGKCIFILIKNAIVECANHALNHALAPDRKTNRNCAGKTQILGLHFTIATLST